VKDAIPFPKSGILLSLVAGALTGVAVALALAPQSGQETRNLIEPGTTLRGTDDGLRDARGRWR
jgi:gas vesicle protein